MFRSLLLILILLGQYRSEESALQDICSWMYCPRLFRESLSIDFLPRKYNERAVQGILLEARKAMFNLMLIQNINFLVIDIQASLLSKG